MKTRITLEVETKMNKHLYGVPEEYIGNIGECPEDEKLTAKDIEKSIHEAIVNLMKSNLVKEQIEEKFNEGGYFDDIEDFEFPNDYCDFKVSVIK